jgi:hypothetical protein
LILEVSCFFEKMERVASELGSLTLDTPPAKTPLRNTMNDESSANSSPSISTARRRNSTPLIKNLSSLPPLRPSPQQQPQKVSFNVNPVKTMKEKENIDDVEVKDNSFKSPPKPEWNSSIISNQTPKRLPWSADLRMVRSPRTPHISQVDVKKQKQVSQLDRIAVLSNRDGFAVPAPKPSGIEELKRALRDMQEKNSVLERKVEELNDELTRVHIENGLLKQRLERSE